MAPVNYEAIWTDVWGDMQRYGPVHRHHRRIFSDMISRVPREQIHTVADMGCGEGSNLLYLQQEFPNAKLFGFDVSLNAIKRAKQMLNAEFAVMDIESDCPDQSFDFVISSDVIEHIVNDTTALRNIYNITNKYALIATVQGRMRSFEKAIGHIRSYDYGEFPEKMRSVGFKIEQVVEWGFPFFSPIYRNMFDLVAVENASHGNYGMTKRLLCQVLYGLFSLNRHDRGDVIFVLASK
ncbi:MAG: class I SAM-dependent methyltransferase [Chloroflexi bacterium SZAS-1]|jgi:SAM-dependent methyltransferase|nr:class I SAM-dependent methyltransferase [Chloroflexi bacterium SZAS-1]